MDEETIHPDLRNYLLDRDSERMGVKLPFACDFSSQPNTNEYTSCRVAVVLDTLSAPCCFVRDTFYDTLAVAKSFVIEEGVENLNDHVNHHSMDVRSRVTGQ